MYWFKNKAGVNVYVGRAAALKARLGSYLNPPAGGRDQRIQKMIAAANKIDYIQTESEIEALILESQLIKQKRPQFNIMLRDDKQYFYVGFRKDELPKIFLTHQPTSQIRNSKLEIRNKSKIISSKFKNFSDFGFRASDFTHIGPFTDGNALKTTLRLLRNIFPYCTCKQIHHNLCLNYHIGKCLGICCLKEQQIPNLQLTTNDLQQIRKEYKQNVKAVKDILNGRRTNLIKQLTKEMDGLARAGKLDQAIAMRSKIEKLRRVFENARIIKSSDILKRHAPFLSSLIRANKSINRVECYDVSNIQGKHATGSMVTFVNGEQDSEFSGVQAATKSQPENLLSWSPDKNYYRKFNISPNFADTNLGGRAGDTQMLQHILERRLNHDEWPFPDLILVDGGKAQVNALTTILKERGVKIPVVGLVKGKKHIGRAIIVPNKKDTIPLVKLTERDRNLLLAIDAEAHRFAIQHYRHRHRKSVEF